MVGPALSHEELNLDVGLENSELRAKLNGTAPVLAGQLLRADPIPGFLALGVDGGNIPPGVLSPFAHANNMSDQEFVQGDRLSAVSTEPTERIVKLELADDVELAIRPRISASSLPSAPRVVAAATLCLPPAPI